MKAYEITTDHFHSIPVSVIKIYTVDPFTELDPI